MDIQTEIIKLLDSYDIKINDIGFDDIDNIIEILYNTFINFNPNIQVNE